MKLLRALLEMANMQAARPAAPNPIDPSVITAEDVASYVELVTAVLGDTPPTPDAVADAVGQVAEDDPKFGANPAIIQDLAAAVCKQLCGMGESKEEVAAPVVEEVEQVTEIAQKVGESWDKEEEEECTMADKKEVKRPAKLSPRAEKALKSKIAKSKAK